jgi:hypothetical protein
MAFLSGLWAKNDAAPAAAPAPATAPAAAGPASKQSGVPNPGADPVAMVTPATGAAPAPGPIPEMSKFNDLFKMKPVDPNAPKRPTLADPILAPLDQATFQQQVSQANFAAAISPDLLAKAAAGDAAALGQAINQASQAAFAAGTQLTHGLVEHGSRTAAERLDGSLGIKIRNQQISMQNVDNPVLQHPAVAPLVGVVKAQIANQNPQATPAEVLAATTEYFTNMVSAFQAPAKAQETAAMAADKSKTNFKFLLDDGV